MGTRGTISVWQRWSKDEKPEHLVTLYVQYDSYPEGLGKELAEFILSGRLVNGISRDDASQVIFNGPGCFAAQLIKELKKDAGGVYIHPKDDSQEYNYKVVVMPKEGFGDKQTEGGFLISCAADYDKEHECKDLTPEEFLRWCKGEPIGGVPKRMRPTIPKEE